MRRSRSGAQTRGCWSSWSRWSSGGENSTTGWPQRRGTRSKEDGKEDDWWTMRAMRALSGSVRTMTKSWSSPFLKCKFSGRMRNYAATDQMHPMQREIQTAPTPRQEVPTSMLLDQIAKLYLPRSNIQSFVNRSIDHPVQAARSREKHANSKQAEYTGIFTRSSFSQSSFYTERSFYTQQLLQTEVFPHRNFCTEKSLHKVTFTHRRLYTQSLLQRQDITQSLRACKQTSFYTQTRLHRSFYIKKSLYTEELLHTEDLTQRQITPGPFAHRSFYTEKSLYKGVLHAEAFTQRSLYAEKLLHTEAVKPRSISEKSLHTGAFTNRSF